MALGLHLSGLGCKLHALGVCDDPDYFYNYIDGLLEGMGATKETLGQPQRPLSLYTRVTVCLLSVSWAWCCLTALVMCAWVQSVCLSPASACCLSCFWARLLGIWVSLCWKIS